MAGRGTLLNAAAVALGSAAGMLAGAQVRVDIRETALFGIGIVTFGMGLRMFLQTRNVLLVAGSIALGGVLGKALGIDVGLDQMAEAARNALGGAGRFNEGLVTASVLFCVGPLTLLGCIQDGVEGRIELLALKSLMDGLASFFLAATLGVGVLASALVVLVFQGALTLLARPLRSAMNAPEIVQEVSAAGGLILATIGLSLTGIVKFPAEVFLPALVFAWIFAKIGRRAGAALTQPASPAPVSEAGGDGSG